MRTHIKFILALALFAVAVTTCKKDDEVTEITITQGGAITMEVGEKITITLNVKPDKAAGKVTLKSSDPAVVSVSGLQIEAKAVGTATVTASAGKKSVDCKITVEAPEPVLAGTVSIAGDAVYDQTLTAVTTALTSNPAGTTPSGLTYRWRRGTTNIGGATASTYKLVQDDIGSTITVVVAANNCTGNVASAATAAVAKASQTAPEAPALSSRTTTSITLATVAGAEYRKGTDGWQDSPEFTGLSVETSYSFTQRLKETPTHIVSNESAAANISTAAAGTPALSGTVTIIGTATFDQTLMAVTTALTSNPAGTTPSGLTYQWRRGTSSIGGATSATYTLMADDVGNTISVAVSANNCTGSVISAETAAVAKAAQTTPAAPTMASNTTTSITLATVAGAEYRRGTGAWQDSPEFSGLTAATSYSFTQRLKETPTHLASNESAEANINTAANSSSNPTLPGDFNPVKF